jgi:sugar lactone lactonase YvrE
MKKKSFVPWYLPLIVVLIIMSCKKTNDSGSSGSTTGGTSGTGTGSPVSTYAGNTAAKGSLLTPTDICFDNSGNLYVSEVTNSDVKVINASGVITTLTGMPTNPGCEDVGSTLTFPGGICFAHDSLYVADYICGHVKMVSLTGSAKTYQFNNPNNYSASAVGVCFDNAGNLFMADQSGDEGVLEITVSGQTIHFGDGTVGYKDGSAATAEFGFMSSICADNNGNVYVADSHRIRKISSGTVTTVAGNSQLGAADGQGAAASFGGAMGLCCDSKGNIYIADTNNNLIRMMTAGGNVTTLAGDGNQGYVEGNGSAAEFNAPSGVCTDASGNLYVADYGNNVVRKIVL